MARLLVIVSYKVFPAQMGGQKGIVHFYDHLKLQHAIRLAVSGDNEELPNSYPVDRILFTHSRMALNILRISAMRKMIRTYRINAIIAEHSYTGWMAWLLKKWTGIPFIIHSHNIECSRFRQMGRRGWKAYQHYEKWIHRKADFSFFKTEEEKQFALKAFSLSASRCDVIPYGVNRVKKVANANQKLRQKYGIRARYIFYFNGTLDYLPNQVAVEHIVNDINPLLQEAGIDYIFLISGKGLSPILQQAIQQANNLCYIGFAEDLELVYQGACLFLNPVINNSGVKTKLVEALANNCTVVSTESGATGIPKDLCGQKLVTTEDGNWHAFTNAILDMMAQAGTNVTDEFLTYFSWSNIAQKAARQIQVTINHA
jgi:glycosyltransferase involved in cell wall biosynthesis